MRFVVNIGDCV